MLAPKVPKVERKFDAKGDDRKKEETTEDQLQEDKNRKVDNKSIFWAFRHKDKDYVLMKIDQYRTPVRAACDGEDNNESETGKISSDTTQKSSGTNLNICKIYLMRVQRRWALS